VEKYGIPEPESAPLRLFWFGDFFCDDFFYNKGKIVKRFLLLNWAGLLLFRDAAPCGMMTSAKKGILTVGW
jgi:hypothetical protein